MGLKTQGSIGRKPISEYRRKACDMLGRVSRHIDRYPMARAAWMTCSARSPHPLCPKVRGNIEALHLAGIVVDWSQRDAAHRAVTVPGQQQTASRRRVLARQGDELGLEILEAKFDPQALGVLAEQFADDWQVFGRTGRISITLVGADRNDFVQVGGSRAAGWAELGIVVPG